MKPNDVAALVTRYFRDIGEQTLKGFAAIRATEPYQVASVTRTLRRMASAGLPGATLTSHFADLLQRLVCELLPAARRGLVPGLSFSGRHSRMERWLWSRLERQLSSTPTVLDIGCGYPPITSVEWARAWPEVRVVGIDPQLPGYLFERDDVHAVFTPKGELSYAMSAKALASINDETTSQTLKRSFTEARMKLAEGLEFKGQLAGAHVRLVRDPVLAYAMNNLSFERRDIAGAGRHDADALRCLNVFPYFSAKARVSHLNALAQLVKPGGLVVVGINWIGGSEAHYALYRRGDELLRTELAFSIDNLRPLGPIPWFEIYADKEIGELCRLVRTLRDDAKFSGDFDAWYERKVRELGIARRQKEFDIPPLDAPTVQQATRELMQAVQNETLVERAVEILQLRGYRAELNAGGEISVFLSPEPLSLGDRD